MFRSFGSFEVSALVEAEQPGKDALREAADGGVEFFGCIVEIGACHVDAVFSAF